MRHHLRSALLVIAGSLILAAGVSSQDEKKPAKTGFTISKETTFFTEPVTKDGYVDYLAAINAKMKAGVTPDNNAMVPLMKALGPKPEGSRIHADFYQQLGIAEPPEAGEYLIDLHAYIKAHQLDMSDEQESELHTRITHRPWTKKEFPEMVKWVEVNARPLTKVNEANQRTEYYLPFVNKSFNQQSDDTESTGSLMSVLLPTVQRCRGMANVLLARAMLNAGEKNYQAAWDDLYTAMKLARVVSKGVTLIELLVGVAISDVAGEVSLVLLDQPDLPLALIQKMAKEVEQLPALGGMGDKISVGERSMMLETLLLVHRYGPEYLEAIAGGQSGLKKPVQKNTVLHSVDWDPQLKQINAHYDRLVSQFNEKDFARRKKLMEEFDQEVKRNYTKTREANSSPLRFLYKPEKRVQLMTDTLIVLLTPALIKVQTASDRQTQRQRNLQVAIALALFKKKKGTYPATLSELSPAYLKTIPNDLFSDQPLIYQKTEKGYRFYSVGPNGKDDGGLNYQEKPGCDDITVTMPVPPLPKPE